MGLVSQSRQLDQLDGRLCTLGELHCEHVKYRKKLETEQTERDV